MQENSTNIFDKTIIQKKIAKKEYEIKLLNI